MVIAAYIILTAGALVAGWLLLQRRLHRWGATAAELTAALPGDQIVQRPRLAYTQAITIQAPPAAVWPWLVQMGDSRGGLYSYDWLENLMGCNMHSADRIIPELQNLQIGDMIKIAPPGGPSVREIEPNRYLLLAAHVDENGQYMAQTWVFCLEPVGSGATRLITRSHIDYGPPSVLNWFMWDAFGDKGGVVMQRKMLLGIKQRAEATAAKAAA